MEILAGLVCFVVVLALFLAIIAVVGHGLWLMAAGIFGRDHANATPRSRSRLFRACVGCGDEFRSDENCCPWCGLDPHGKSAHELNDLEAAARMVQRLRDDGTLATETAEAVYQGIERRQRELLPTRSSRRTVEPIREPEAGPNAQLEAWLGVDLGVGLTVERKQKALALLRALSPEDLRTLSAATLAGAARLQNAVGLMSRARETYQMVLECHPESAWAAQAALESLRLALRVEDQATAGALAEVVEKRPDWIAAAPELAGLVDRVLGKEAEVVSEPAPAPALETVNPGVPSLPPLPIETPAAPPPPRRSFAEWIGVFMEERNILWGELIGGTLIVGCSIALVISLWKTLEGIEFFPFLILAAITSALFAAGFYTLHHWKLESTSRGLLLIATLLVPLSFLVLAGLIETESAGLLYYATGGASLTLFGWLLLRSSRILIQAPLEIPGSALAVALAVLVPAGAQLAAPLALADDSRRLTFLYLLSLLPALAQASVLGWLLLRLSDAKSWSIARLVAMLIALGSVTFACGSVFGFLVGYPLRFVDLSQLLVPLAPALTLMGTPILFSGILTRRKLRTSPSPEMIEANPGETDTAGLWRTLGTALGLTGIVVMFGGFVISIDDPIHRGIAGSINLAALLSAAWVLRVPVLHGPAQVYLAALAIFGWDFDPLRLIESPASALKLVGLLAVQVALAEWLARRNRGLDARFYAAGGAVSTGLALLLNFPFWFTDPGIAALVFGSVAAIWWAANLRWRLAEISYACSTALAVAIYFASRYALDLPMVERMLWVLLTHATICLGACVGLRLGPARLNDSFRVPLEIAGLIATGLAAGVIGIELFDEAASWATLCQASAWLAGLWLMIAVLESLPLLFAGFQIALSLVWFFGAAAWLTIQGWHWREPHSVQIHLLGLATLGLFWEVIRLGASSRPRLARLVVPTFCGVDRVITGGVFVVYYVLCLSVVSWSVGRELTPTADGWRLFPADWQAQAFSIWAWLPLAPLVGVLLLRFRQREVALPLLGCTLLALALPTLASGTWFDADLAGASALRWGLMLCYALGGVLLWNRRLLGAKAERVPSRAIRGLLAFAALAPVLVITLIVTATKLSGLPLGGPESGVFQAMGGPASLLIPLALLSATLAGHGLRERLAYYLLAAGMLLTATSVGAYFLALQRMEQPFDQAWVAPVALILATGTIWLATIGWTWVASVLELSEPRPLLDSTLLSLLGFLGAVLFAGVLGSALLWIMFGSGDDGRTWTQTVGSPWSWLAFALLAFGSCFLHWQRRAAVPLHLLGFLGMAAVGVAACSVEVLFRDQGFSALMFLSGVFACGWVASQLYLDPKRAPSWLTCSQDLHESIWYAVLPGGLAMFLGSAALFDGTKPAVWSAESIVLAACASGLLAYQRKKELWASFATMLLLPACTILVLHFDAENPSRWLRVIQLDLAILGGMSIVRLGLRRHLAMTDSVRALRHLPIQLGLGLAGIGILYFIAALSFAPQPAQPGEWLSLSADWAGWLALVTNGAAALWYFALVAPRHIVHVFTVLGLMAGIAIAGSAEMGFGGAWVAHHVLTLTWTLLGLVVLILAWTGQTQIGIGPRFWPAERRSRWADFVRQCFPALTARVWVTLCGGLVVALLLRAASVEPGRVAWSVGNTLAVSVLLGALAIWARASFFVYASGLLFNVIGLLLFSAWSSHRFNLRGPMLGNDEWLSYGILAQVLSFGVAAIVWSMLERKLHGKGFDLERDDSLSFPQFALNAGIHLLAVGVVLSNGLHLAGEEIRIGMTLAWIALGVLALAVGFEFLRPQARGFTRHQFYTCGLLAIGLGLHGLALPNADWLRFATLMLAGYVLLIVVLARLIHAIPKLRGLSELSDGRWFWNFQLGTVALIGILSTWLALTQTTAMNRLAGALGCGIVALAAYLLIHPWPRIHGHISAVPIWMALVLALASMVNACWGCIDLDMPAIWLQRTGALMGVLGLATLALRLGPARWLNATVWTTPMQALGSMLGVVSVVCLLGLLGQEFVFYDAAVRRTLLRLEWGIFSSLAIFGVTALALHSALATGADPYGIEGERRSVYVYLTEFLALALLAHLRLNLPALIPPVLGQYWFLSVMVLAFLGIALGDLFTRRGLPVLATPIKRSAMVLAFVPVLAFRLVMFSDVLQPLAGPIPGLTPFLAYLARMSANYPMEALCWVLLGVFFGWLAKLRDSANHGVFAALWINFGVWVLLGHEDATTFLQRPQLWLIPLGLIILVAEHVNRDRLGFWPSLSVRYSGLLCIYLSSTIEMFMEGLGANPIFPIALALLAVVGMMLGILFRVRAFLLSGFLALLVVVFAQIWHAAVDRHHTWIWWACGILLGVIILATFALFEKHRNEVLKVLDNMKRWH